MSQSGHWERRPNDQKSGWPEVRISSSPDGQKSGGPEV